MFPRRKANQRKEKERGKDKGKTKQKDILLGGGAPLPRPPPLEAGWGGISHHLPNLRVPKEGGTGAVVFSSTCLTGAPCLAAQVAPNCRVSREKPIISACKSFSFMAEFLSELPPFFRGLVSSPRVHVLGDTLGDPPFSSCARSLSFEGIRWLCIGNQLVMQRILHRRPETCYSTRARGKQQHPTHKIWS